MLLLYVATSCSAYEQVVGAGGNPKPNLKGVHFAITHQNYTAEEYKAHCNHDCSMKCTPKICDK